MKYKSRVCGFYPLRPGPEKMEGPYPPPPFPLGIRRADPPYTPPPLFPLGTGELAPSPCRASDPPPLVCVYRGDAVILRGEPSQCFAYILDWSASPIFWTGSFVGKGKDKNKEESGKRPPPPVRTVRRLFPSFILKAEGGIGGWPRPFSL